MAYIDQRTGRNQRAAVMTVVAVIQGAVIVALVNGLAVHFIKPPPPAPPPEADQIRLTPPPKPPEPARHPREQQQHLDNPVHPTPAPFLTPDVVPFTPTLPKPDPIPTQAFELPKPEQPKLSLPHLAKPKGSPANWATTNDYPARDLREGNQGLVRFSLTIGADGKVVSCQILESSNSPGLDAATCSNVTRRARFEPATDAAGNRTTGAYSGSIRWVIPRD